MWHLYYNIHDLVTIEITGTSRFDQSKKLRYAFFETEKILDPDIVLRLGKFKPSTDGCQVISHKYHVKENYLYCRDAIGNAKWEVEISGFNDGKTEVNFWGKRKSLRGLLLSDYWAQDIIRPIIEYKMSQKGYFLIHGGAVAKKSDSYVFSGRQGAFKTTIIMDLVRKAGFDFMGDERVIIGKDKVLSFPASLFLFDHCLKHSATEKLGELAKIKLLHKIFSGKHEYDVPISANCIPSALYFVEKEYDPGIMCNPLGVNHVIKKLVANNQLELVIPSPGLPSSNFLQYIMAYAFVFPRSRMARYWDDFETRVETVIQKIPAYVMKIPDYYNVKIFNDIKDSVQN